MSHPPRLPAPLYEGGVNDWECNGGHLNVNFQFARALSGLGYLAHAMGMPRAFTPEAGATLVVQEAYVRFLKEARPGAGLAMYGGVVRMGESDATLCLDMRHTDGAPATAFTFTVVHADTRGFRSFPWTNRTRDAAAKLICTPPAQALPRSVDVNAPHGEVSIARALELGAVRVGASMVQPADCDAFGRMRGEHVFGRTSDAVLNLLERLRGAVGGAAALPGGAVLEARLVFRHWPRAGDLIEVHSGVTEVNDKTRRIVHWLCDPETGNGWASVELFELAFDQATRKNVALSPDARAALSKHVVAMTV
jgi:acyl-CoA thioester hydrolase